MMKKLWSINALATEFDLDRREVAKRLTGVRSDGQIAGHLPWHLDSALAVMQPKKRHQPTTADGLLEIVLARLEDWRKIYVENPKPGEATGAVMIEDVARCSLVEPEDVLSWLWAGCPYLQEGDWDTGGGFVLRYTWAAEWAQMMLTSLKHAGEWQGRRSLRFDKGVFAS